MRVESISDRLKHVMSDRNLKQTDILKLAEPYCKQFGINLGRNDISQYVSGKVEPKYEKVRILACALDVDEAWLIGFNVPMGREISIDNANKLIDALVTHGIDLNALSDDKIYRIANIAKLVLG